IVVEHWLTAEERWDDDPPGDALDAEVLAGGYAPWEVRIPAPDRDAARRLARELEEEGYGVVRRFRFVIAGCGSREEAEALARRPRRSLGRRALPPFRRGSGRRARGGHGTKARTRRRPCRDRHGRQGALARLEGALRTAAGARADPLRAPAAPRLRHGAAPPP